jgi:hypothetical protein
MDTLLGMVEGLATSFKKFDQELTANVSAHDRFEKRITTLELKIKNTETAAL